MFIKNERIYPIPRTVPVPGGTSSVPSFALLAWVSLTRRNLPKCPEARRRFPVVIDTAFSGNLLLQEQHASDWGGLTVTRTDPAATLWQGLVCDPSGYLLARQPEDRTYEGVTGATITCPAFDANLWLHAKEVGGNSIRLELPSGFVLYPRPTTPGDARGPGLPLLGGLALYANDLKLVVDYKNLDFSLGEQV